MQSMLQNKINLRENRSHGLLLSLSLSPLAGSSGVVEALLPHRKQAFYFTLEEVMGGHDGESLVLLERDFRLGNAWPPTQ